MTFGPTRPLDLAPFVIALVAILVISFLARIIQPSAPRSGVYEVKPAPPAGAPKPSPQATARVIAAAAGQQIRRPKRLGDMASRYARIVFGLLS